MTKLEQWAVELFRRAVEAYGGESIPGETECYAARVIQTAFEESERKLREDAARYRWLRDVSCPPHNFYISVPDEFHGVKYGPDEVDAYIDAARAALGEKRDDPSAMRNGWVGQASLLESTPVAASSTGFAVAGAAL